LRTDTNYFGFGNAATFVSVGGPQATTCRLNPGESTIIQIELINHSGFDWNLLAGAIDGDGSVGAGFLKDQSSFFAAPFSYPLICQCCFEKFMSY